MTGKHKQEEKKSNTTEPEEPVIGSSEEESREEEEIAALNDKYLRLYSEFDNYRKRTLRERIELIKTASAEVVTQLLPILDDLERAILAHQAAGEPAVALMDGVNLIYNKFLALLGQQGLEQMKTMGNEFDTDFHEAVTTLPVDDPEMKGKVVDEIQKGYLLNGKVIRFAKVVVGS